MAEPIASADATEVRCAICGVRMGWLHDATRWQRFRLWLTGGSYCSTECWAEGVH